MPFMRFTEDKYLNDELFALANTQVNVDEASVDRWIKRGGVVVDDPNYVSVPNEIVEPVGPTIVDTKDGPPNLLAPDELIKTDEVVAPSSPVVRRGPGRPKRI